MTTRSSRSNEDGRSRNKSAPKKQTEEQSTEGHEDNDESAVTSENSAATQIPTPSRIRTCSSKKNDGDSSKTTTSENRQTEEQSMKGKEDDDDVFQCQICNKTFTDFVQIKQKEICVLKMQQRI